MTTTRHEKLEQEKTKKEHREKYPECTKLSDHREDILRITEFLDWLNEKKRIRLCVQDKYLHKYYPQVDPQQKLLREYFEIDESKLEAELRQILEEHRKLNER